MPLNDKARIALIWGVSPAGITFGDGAEPGSKEFFESVLGKRSAYEQPWLFELVPFFSFRDKKVLEFGCGAGYDAYEFCRNGADYTGFDIAAENPQRTRKHLEFYGFAPKVLVGDVENAMFASESFDVVFANGVLHHTPDIERSIRESYRLLKHGGEFWVILYHKNSIFYWVTLFLVRHILKLGFLRQSFKERLSSIEYTTSATLPLVNVHSRGVVKGMLDAAGFAVESIWVRKLVKEDLPLSRLWWFVPQAWLDFVGKYFGWYVIAKASKA